MDSFNLNSTTTAGLVQWMPTTRVNNLKLGVRAHIQHLQAYATKEETQLNKELIDPRYNWVHKTKYIETIFELTGTWATDPHYGEKIDGLLTAMGTLNY